MNKSINRSPFFYVGDKYKLMPQLKKLFPENINKYIEPFAGGGSAFLNTKAKKYILNDIDNYIIALHKKFYFYKDKPEDLFNALFNIIDEYGFSCSLRNKNVPEQLKKIYVKTYYAKFNKDSYTKLRQDFNNDKNNLLYLYILLIYGFNHMIRFNSKGEFNLPVGNVDFNKNVYDALNNYLVFSKNNDLLFSNSDYKDFLDNIEFERDDYVYCDPPYLISNSEYNKLWNEKKEIELYSYLDRLDKNGINFGITNLIYHKGNENKIFKNWSQKYIIYDVNSNYISYNDNSIKINSKEVFVTNYENKRI